MKDINYIDKIVKDSIGNMQVPVNSSWNNILDKTKDIPQVHSKPSGSILSSLTAKIVAGFTIVAGIIASVFMFNTPKTDVAKIKQPVDCTIKIVTTREAEDVIIEIDYNNGQIADNQTINNTQIIDKDTSASVVIINVETTDIDTLHNY